MSACRCSHKGIELNELEGVIGSILSDNESKTSLFSKLYSGFEDWFKFEVLHGIHKTTCKEDNHCTHCAGVEHTATLDAPPDTNNRNKKRKRIDLWFRSSNRGSEEHKNGQEERCKTCHETDLGPWNYIEFTVAFDNTNKDKMVSKWKHDFDALRNLDDCEHTDGVMSVLIYVGRGDMDAETQHNENIKTIWETDGMKVIVLSDPPLNPSST